MALKCLTIKHMKLFHLQSNFMAILVNDTVEWMICYRLAEVFYIVHRLTS